MVVRIALTDKELEQIKETKALLDAQNQRARGREATRAAAESRFKPVPARARKYVDELEE